MANIAGAWPAVGVFDGAICAEVIEHLTPDEATSVITNIKTHVTQGFVLSVPARETLEAKTMQCPSCGRWFHIWGHRRSFASFQDVDRTAGQQSIARTFVRGMGRHDLLPFVKLKRALGIPLDAATVCMHCGVEVPAWPEVAGLRWLALKGTRALEIALSPAIPATGWFVCRYRKEEM